jgi:hypothetical protein
MWELSLEYSKVTWQRNQNSLHKQTIVSLNFEKYSRLYCILILQSTLSQSFCLRKIDNRVQYELDAEVMEAITKVPAFGDRKLLHAYMYVL